MCDEHSFMIIIPCKLDAQKEINMHFLKTYSNIYSTSAAIEQVAIHFIDLCPPKMWPMLCMFFLLRAGCVEEINRTGIASVAFLHCV